MKLITKIILLSVILLESQFAQTGNISGTVRDEDFQPIEGANIELIGTEYFTTSNDSGYFSLQVPNGVYKLKVEMLGFYDHVTSGIEVKDNNVKLSLGMHLKLIISDQVVISAGKYEQQISELPVSASIMKSDEIAAKNFPSLDYAIRYAPGVNMNLDQVSIRGSSGYSRGAGTRVLVAMDGIPIYTGDTGEISWELIPVTEIDKLEIIKGAASSLYGSSAIGGVINVISKPIPQNPLTYIKTYAGVYDKPAHNEWNWSDQYRPFNGLTLTHSNKIDDLGFTLSLTRTENQSYRQSDFLKRYTGFFKVAYQFNSSSSLTLMGNGLHQNRGNFIYWKDSRHILQPPDADQGQRVISDRYMAGALYKNVFSDNFFINVRGSYYNTHWRDQSTSGNDSRTEILHGEIQSTYHALDNLFVISGIEANAGKVKSNLFSNPTSSGFGLYTQADYHFSFPMLISAGVRFDYSKLDVLKAISSVSPKLGINYKVDDEIILRASAGKGFRAPTLAEAFTNTTASFVTIKPNPKLVAEHNYTFEIGINKSISDFAAIDAAFFNSEYYDFIEPGVDPIDTLIHFDNVTRARLQGSELNLSIQLIPDLLNVDINYLYLWARDIEKNKSLKYRPRNSVTTKIDYAPGIFNFGIDFRYWSRVEELDTELVDFGIVKDGTLRVPVYVVDFTGGINLAEFGIPCKANINLNNAFNYNYIEIIGNLAPIRNISLSLEIVF